MVPHNPYQIWTDISGRKRILSTLMLHAAGYIPRMRSISVHRIVSKVDNRRIRIRKAYAEASVLLPSQDAMQLSRSIKPPHVHVGVAARLLKATLRLSPSHHEGYRIHTPGHANPWLNTKPSTISIYNVCISTTVLYQSHTCDSNLEICKYI
jgi:hypothetical protein